MPQTKFDLLQDGYNNLTQVSTGVACVEIEEGTAPNDGDAIFLSFDFKNGPDRTNFRNRVSLVMRATHYADAEQVEGFFHIFVEKTSG